MNSEPRRDGLEQPEVPHPSGPGGDLNRRGGQIDIEDRPGKGKVEEASEESFPASDPPSFTPAGYIDCPPPCKK